MFKAKDVLWNVWRLESHADTCLVHKVSDTKQQKGPLERWGGRIYNDIPKFVDACRLVP